MASDNRRDFLRLAAASAGGAGVNFIPAVVQKALALPAHRATGTLQDVEHIVILVQENRSFDHYFGSLKGVRGFGDPRPATLPGGKSVWHQPAPAGEVLPFRPAGPDLGLQFLQGTPHDWTTTQRAWNEGRYDQWIAAKGSHTMAYFTRADIPFHYALADAFTVCDAYHCSLLGPTDPNRYHLWTGWVGNDGRGGGPVITNAEAGYSWSTYPERLERAGIRWKIYQDVGTGLDAAGEWGYAKDPYVGNYGDNSLLYFDRYRQALPGSPLYDKARTGTRVGTGAPQGLFAPLKADVAAGRLPQVSWIVAPEAYSEHPNFPSNYGAWYIEQVLEILTSDPATWGRTALFVTYDENDGFFDHVVPPTPAATRSLGLSTVDTSREIFPGDAKDPSGPYGLGPRVPMLVLSPWTRGGWVCSEVFDHTSLIRFIERRFDNGDGALVETNISAWRRAICGDLTSAFDFENPNAVLPDLPRTTGYLPADRARHPDVVPRPPAVQRLPTQEPGTRWLRASPYDFDVRGRLDARRGVFEIAFANAGRAGAVLRVGRQASAEAPRTYTVEAGKRLSDTWPVTRTDGGAYDLIVAGPGGFHRQFRGAAAGAAGDGPEASGVHLGQHGGRLRLILANPGPTPVRMTVTPNGYTRSPARTFTLPPSARLDDVWELEASFGWYDLGVTVDGDPGFLRRLAGRVETGRPGVSDPMLA